MKQAHIFVSGMVQGVGYRYFVRNNARKLGIVGWVRNLPDRRVEAIFQGTEEKLQEMLALCRQGPFLSEVKNLQVDWRDGKEALNEFEIRK
jgi:acylphosphatase